MGLEPTTFCMANARKRSRPFAQPASLHGFGPPTERASESEAGRGAAVDRDASREAPEQATTRGRRRRTAHIVRSALQIGRVWREMKEAG